MNRTLAEIRADIQVRLGFGMAGQAGVVNSPLIDSMIRSAQDQLYQQHDWLKQKGFLERTLGTSQQFFDYPEDCDEDRVHAISVRDSGYWRQLQEGILPEHRSLVVQGNVPRRYNRAAQIEVWPIPNKQHDIRIDYIKRCDPLTADNHRTTIDDGLVFLLALVNAKTHYKQDADRLASQLDATLMRMRSRNRGRSVWSSVEAQPDPFSYPPAST